MAPSIKNTARFLRRFYTQRCQPYKFKFSASVFWHSPAKYVTFFLLHDTQSNSSLTSLDERRQFCFRETSYTVVPWRLDAPFKPRSHWFESTATSFQTQRWSTLPSTCPCYSVVTWRHSVICVVKSSRGSTLFWRRSPNCRLHEMTCETN